MNTEIPSLPEMPDGIMIRMIQGESYYAVSTDGLVWSCRLKGRWGHTCPWKVLKVQLAGKVGKGYYFAALYSKSKSNQRYVHHLVLETFVGPCPPGMECCHEDGNRRNNRLDNLRWDTRPNNHADKHRHGTALIGEKSNLAKLTSASVVEIRQLRSDGVRLKEIASRFGIQASQVSHICLRKSWKHI